MVANKDKWSTGFESAKVPRESKNTNALVGEGCSINGILNLEGEVHILGSVQGEIHAKDDLVIEEPASVEAKVEGTRVTVFGKVIGDIVCSERLELHAGASVTGDISSPVLIIREGVVFEGHCRMQKANKAVPEQKASVVDIGVKNAPRREESSKDNLAENIRD